MVNVANFFALLFFTSTIFGVEFDENTFALTLSNDMLINQIKLCGPIINHESSPLQSLKSLSNALICAITDISKDASTSCLSMFLHHDFFVSEDEMVTHNIFPVIPAIASLTVSLSGDWVIETSIALFNVRM